jgi:ABC-2 type transport system ATP-binding protein
VTFRFHYRIEERLQKPVFGLSIMRIDGAEVTSPNTREAGLVPEQLAGCGYVDMKLDLLPLVPGTYDLSVSLVNHTLSHFFDCRYRAVRFDVEPGTPYAEYGILALTGDWSISADKV